MTKFHMCRVVIRQREILFLLLQINYKLTFTTKRLSMNVEFMVKNSLYFRINFTNFRILPRLRKVCKKLINIALRVNITIP